MNNLTINDCPVCGSHPNNFIIFNQELGDEHERKWITRMVCLNCMHHIYFNDLFNTKQDAEEAVIRVWNRGNLTANGK